MTTATCTTGRSSLRDDWEKEFFTTWLRLMERQKDETKLLKTLQNLLLTQTRRGEAVGLVQDAKHHVNMLKANDKTMTELMTLLNEFFFQNILPALKRARQVENEGRDGDDHEEDESVTTAASNVHGGNEELPQDSLDRYLEHGDENEAEDGTAIPQAFVDDMSGWACSSHSSRGQAEMLSRKLETDTLNAATGTACAAENVARNEDEHTGEKEDGMAGDESDDGIPSDAFHDMLIANSSKMTALHASDKVETYEQLTALSVIEASPQSKPAQTKSTRQSQSQQVSTGYAAKRKDRIGQNAAASLVADQVLDVRTYGTLKEYLIEWQGMATPLWIARRRCPPQAKELIDNYAATLRAQDSTRVTRKPTGGCRGTGTKHVTSHKGDARDADGEDDMEITLYNVDHIVNHRVRYNKKEYLVRWEHYADGYDTWEKAAKLRLDVPKIVEAYEEQLRHNNGEDTASHSAKAEPKVGKIKKKKYTYKKKSSGDEKTSIDKSETQHSHRGGRKHVKKKRGRVSTDKEGVKSLPGAVKKRAKAKVA
uniref:Chromo domain-containing protein n=1 Tax=Hyaloperonospora arabidopsidis (strain Emoy2) TaxID=559515 RepID=M4B9M2_HYAAE